MLDPMWRAIVLVLVAGAIAGCGSSNDKPAPATAAATTTQQTDPRFEQAGGTFARDANTIEFQEPEESGDDPFTEPTDIDGEKTVELPDTPFGGSGSDKVCDRDKLIRFLKKHPDRLREWARVLGIKPTYASVSKDISKLHPVTLSRDTQVTNHAFVDGHAVPFQAILQAGTAVLVDKYGRPVARCRCGNPLTEPVVLKKAICRNCPPRYTPPKQCRFYETRVNYNGEIYKDDYYSNDEYDRAFIRLAGDGPYDECWIVYPDPPVVTIIEIYREPPPEPTPAPPPAQPDPTPYQPPHDDGGVDCNAPRSQLEFEQCRDGQHSQTPEVPDGPTDYIPPQDDPDYQPGTNPEYPDLPPAPRQR
jgi:hypothetical protein